MTGADHIVKIEGFQDLLRLFRVLVGLAELDAEADPEAALILSHSLPEAFLVILHVSFPEEAAVVVPGEKLVVFRNHDLRKSPFLRRLKDPFVAFFGIGGYGGMNVIVR